MSINNNSNNLQAYYLVQRCWFEGPHVEPSVDYLAVFPSQNQAETVTYQSAHKYAQMMMQGNNSNTCSGAVVRTLLLPTGYGCSAAGKLFWVRRVLVEAPGGPGPAGGGQPSAASSSSGAHVIITNGIIGGTGNNNSRRGTEAESNCVFVGPYGHIKALQYMQQNRVAEGSVVSWLPLGVYTDLMQGWPEGRSSSEDDNLPLSFGSVVNNDNSMELEENQQPKRPSLDAQQQGHYNFAAPRPSKRICGATGVPHSTQAASRDVHFATPSEAVGECGRIDARSFEKAGYRRPEAAKTAQEKRRASHSGFQHDRRG